MQHSIHRIDIPNPFFEGQNSVYLLKAEPITLIDTGVATDAAFEHLAGGLRTHGVEVSDVERVLLTHKHIDHIGNAWRIQQASNAKVFIHANEVKSLTDVDPSGKRFGEMVTARLKAWGVPDELRSRSTGMKMPQWKLESCEVEELPATLPFTLPDTGAGNLEVIETPGHTMGSVCFHFQDVLFSGDHVLERISPNVGGGDMRSRGMLARFLASLDRVTKLGDVEIFPGHGAAFRGLSKRCGKLARHHQIRLRQAQRAVERGKRSVYQIAQSLYGTLRDFHVVLGCAEANAHLEYLVDQGTITQDGENYCPLSEVT